jgi:hypothetical protein
VEGREGKDGNRDGVLARQTTMCSAGVKSSKEAQCQRLTCMLCGSDVAASHDREGVDMEAVRKQTEQTEQT